MAVIMLSVIILYAKNINVYAADGRISFSDPKVSMGETFSVTVKAQTADLTKISEVWLKLNFDSSALEFVSADNGSLSNGSIVITQTIDSPSSDVYSYNLKFKALKSGTSTINVDSYNISDAKKNAVNITKIGNSTIKIAEGENVSDTTENTENTENQSEEMQNENESEYILEYNGNKYFALEPSSDMTIPEAFTETELEINGLMITAYQNGTDYYLLCLKDQNGESGLYVYCSLDDTFVRYSQDMFTASDGENDENAQKLQTVTKNYNDLFDKYTKEIKSGKNIIYGLIVAVVILIIIIINISFGRKHSMEYEDEEFDDEDDEYNEEDEEDEESEEYDEEYETDDEDDTDTESYFDAKEDMQDDFTDDYDDIDDLIEKEPKKASRREAKKTRDRQRKAEAENETKEEFEMEIFDFGEDEEDE